MHKKFGLRSAQGFTLIELLVVIAIIGILAGIVLVSLGTARNKGNDAKVESQLKGIQSAAEVFYSNGNTYTGMTTDAPSGMTTLMTAANWPGAAAPTVNIDSGGQMYAAYHALTSDATKYWCVDSTGASKQLGTSPGVATNC